MKSTSLQEIERQMKMSNKDFEQGMSKIWVLTKLIQFFKNKNGSQ
jgi:hypothetical protein